MSEEKEQSREQLKLHRSVKKLEKNEDFQAFLRAIYESREANIQHSISSIDNPHKSAFFLGKSEGYKDVYGEYNVLLTDAKSQE